LECSVELWWLTAAKNARPFFTTNRNVALDPVELFLRNLWSHVRSFVHRIANDNLLRLLLESRKKIIFYSFFNKQTLARTTTLALVEEDSHHGAVHSLFQIGVSENYIWSFATKFE
jgi:hypothetical protein